MVKLYPYRFKHLKNVHKGLLRRYEGPFPVVKKIGRVAYKIEVPSHLEIHLVFHVSQLKPYHNDMEHPRRKESRRAPTLVTTAHEREVDTIFAHRVIPRRGVHPSYKQYLVTWKGLPDCEASWEDQLTLCQYKDLIQAFHEDATMRTSHD
ncbi:hypothetical protein LINPERHAP1_LOCUS43946 [Linum perenne]